MRNKPQVIFLGTRFLKFLSYMIIIKALVENFSHLYFKCYVHCIFARSFCKSKSAFVKQGKLFFISLQKLFSFRDYQILAFSDIQIS